MPGTEGTDPQPLFGHAQKQAAVMCPLQAFRDPWEQSCCPHAALSLMPPALGRST